MLGDIKLPDKFAVIAQQLGERTQFDCQYFESLLLEAYSAGIHDAWNEEATKRDT